MIDTIKDEELKIKQEDLLKNMKLLRHTVTDMFGSKSFLKGLTPEPHNGVITVYGEQFPIYISANIISTKVLPDISDDIFDKDNYLSLLTDDDIMWYALVEHLAHQADLLQEDNNKYSDELVAANEEMDKLNCKLAEEIKARQGYEESLKQLRDELTAANNEINELEEDRKETNKKCSEYVKEIDKLSVDNKRLSERVKTLVIEKTNRPDTAEKVSDPDVISRMETAYTTRTLELLSRITELENENEKLSERVRTLVCEKCNDGKDLSLTLKLGEQERGTPEDKIVKVDLETALMQQQIAQLNTRITHLEEKLHSTETELITANNANGILKTKIAALADEKREAELLAYRLTRGEMHVQFDSMKSLEHENGVLKNENADLNQKLCQKVMHATYSAHGEEPEDDLKKKYDEVLDYNKKLRQEITALRIEAGKSVADSVLDSNAAEDNEDMQQTIAKETMSDLTERINELETKLKDKDECINQLSKHNSALSIENKNFGDLLKNADRDAKFYAREVDHLRQENDKIYSILNDAVKVVQQRNKNNQK